MKLSIYILTSRNEKLALRALESVRRQITAIDIVPIVMVNSMDGDYYGKIVYAIGDSGLQSATHSVVESESNGKPGKGKNACLRHFMNSDSDYMMLIDGDDFLYPRAIQILERTLVGSPDIVCGCAQDHLTKYDPVELTSWQSDEPNLAMTNNRDIYRPEEYNLWHNFSIDRLFLLKKNELFYEAFPEDFDLYEDFIFTAVLTQFSQEGKIDYIRINNSFIYCYDAVEQGQCLIFNTNPELANKNMKMFWSYIDGLLEISDHRPIKFSETQFMKLGTPFRFSHQDKYEYIKELNQMFGL